MSEQLALAIAKAVRRHDKEWPECAGAGVKREEWAINCLAERIILPMLRPAPPEGGER
jgi:hypothetical protein